MGADYRGVFIDVLFSGVRPIYDAFSLYFLSGLCSSCAGIWFLIKFCLLKKKVIYLDLSWVFGFEDRKKKIIIK